MDTDFGEYLYPYIRSFGPGSTFQVDQSYPLDVSEASIVHAIDLGQAVNVPISLSEP